MRILTVIVNKAMPQSVGVIFNADVLRCGLMYGDKYYMWYVLALIIAVTGLSDARECDEVIAEFPWFQDQEYGECEYLAAAIEPPKGFERVEVKPYSYQEWLRCLPLSIDPQRDTTLRQYDGRPARHQQFCFQTLMMDTQRGQQCADVAIRLRAEYLYALRHFLEFPNVNIQFHSTSKQKLNYSEYVRDTRFELTLSGNTIIFTKNNETLEDSYQNFQIFLSEVFDYASTKSIPLDLNDPSGELEPGDILSYPRTENKLGHAITVIDKAVNSKGEIRLMFAQGNTPAVTPHIIRNTAEDSPWFTYDPNKSEIKVSGTPMPYQFREHWYRFPPSPIETLYEERMRELAHLPAEQLPVNKPQGPLLPLGTVEDPSYAVDEGY